MKVDLYDKFLEVIKIIIAAIILGALAIGNLP